VVAESKPACCGEKSCQRRQPIRLARDNITGAWWVVTSYAERADDRYEAQQKHLLHPADAAELEAYRLAYQRTLTVEQAEDIDTKGKT
jgi:hypothetical protein